MHLAAKAPTSSGLSFMDKLNSIKDTNPTRYSKGMAFANAYKNKTKIKAPAGGMKDSVLAGAFSGMMNRGY